MHLAQKHVQKELLDQQEMLMREDEHLEKEPMKQLVLVLHVAKEWQVLVLEVMRQQAKAEQQMVLAQKDVEDLALWRCYQARH